MYTAQSSDAGWRELGEAQSSHRSPLAKDGSVGGEVVVLSTQTSFNHLLIQHEFIYTCICLLIP